jgi:hypothetical protein
MKKAGQREREIAIAKGHVNSDGMPEIWVCVDGCWSKRTFGHSYDASAGMVIILNY